MKVVLGLLGILLFSGANADYCGGNCWFGECPGCLCESEPNYVNIAAWCSQYNWDVNLCKCIVEHESSGNSNRMTFSSSTLKYSVGLWNIEQSNWAICNNGKPPCSLDENLKCAIAIYGWAGQSFSGWWSYNHGCESLHP